MIALEKMRRVDVEVTNIPSVDSWNWSPGVRDRERLREELSQPNATNGTTTNQTFPGQWDHGEWK